MPIPSNTVSIPTRHPIPWLSSSVPHHQLLDLPPHIQAPRSVLFKLLYPSTRQNRIALRRTLAITSRKSSDTEFCTWSRAAKRGLGKLLKVFKTFRKIAGPHIT
jgi:hypothetical protein